MNPKKYLCFINNRVVLLEVGLIRTAALKKMDKEQHDTVILKSAE
jgi:hypothetical protein